MRCDREKYDNIASHELYEKLKIVDPATAARFHPNDKRKIMR